MNTTATKADKIDKIKKKKSIDSHSYPKLWYMHYLIQFFEAEQPTEHSGGKPTQLIFRSYFIHDFLGKIRSICGFPHLLYLQTRHLLSEQAANNQINGIMILIVLTSSP